MSKASGLARFAARHGVDAADVVAFGDMPNDLPMLAWAGRGLAVANAHPEVLAAADEVIALIRAPETSFVVVASPHHDTIAEASKQSWVVM